MIISETSHFGVGRAPWMREITDEVRRALQIGVELQGVCIYPILDRPDWEDLSHWHNSGLWDLRPAGSGRLERVFTEENLAPLKGEFAIGHTRYSTTGGAYLRNAQPYLIETIHGPLGVAHNGNLINAVELHSELRSRDIPFRSVVRQQYDYSCGSAALATLLH